MDFRLGLLGLVFLGCGAATPVPDWTPPRAQAPPGQSAGNPQLAEAESRKLPVEAPPKPIKRQSLIVGQAPVSVSRQPVLPHSEPSPDYPRYQGHRADSLPVAVNQAPAPEAGVDFAQVDIDQFLGLNTSSSCAVVLLVDVSGSVFKRGVEVAVDAAAKVYARQSQSDRVWVVAFGSQAEMVVNGHGGVLSRAQLGRALTNSRPANSGTALAPAIQMATNTLVHSALARRVVVVSDGLLQDDQMAVWLAARAYEQNSISFSAVQIGEEWSGAAVLQEIARQTQGRFVNTP